MDLIITILVFFGIILIHEMGHFLTAKMFGMNIYEFSIGMGPRLFSKTTKTTTWSFKLFPIGGAVQLGEDLESDDPNDYRNKPVWQRMIVIVAGAVMNLILGLIVCTVSVLCSDSVTTTRIYGFDKGAVSAGVLMPDDEIVGMSGVPVWTTMDLGYCFMNTAPRVEGDIAYFDMTVIRGGERLDLSVPFYLKPDTDLNGTAGIDVDFIVIAEDKNFFNVVRASFGMFLTQSRMIWISFHDLITGTYGLNDLSGPVGVVSTMSTAIKVMSFNTFILLIALITINLGIFNLLPIPALDGARFIFLLIEAIRKKPIAPEKEGTIHFVGFMALMVLMVVVTFNDIGKLFAH